MDEGGERSGGTVYEVVGMTCGGCVSAVRRAVERALPGRAVRVELEAGALEVGGPRDDAAVRAAVEAAGFELGAGAGEPAG